MTLNLGKRDREILKLLNMDCRRSDSDIAKKLNISKQSVGYRIKKLQEKGIIKNFYTEFNLGKLGYNSYYIFIELERITNKIENDIISKLVNEPNIGWIINGIGSSTIILLVYSRTLVDFENLYFQIKNICADSLRDTNFSILTNSHKLSYRFLGEDLGSVQTEKSVPMILDNQDKRLMNAISQNAREKIVAISVVSYQSIDVVRYRLDKLKSNNIITGFRMKLDVTKLGMQWYLLLIKLQPISESEKIKLLNYLYHQKEVYYLTSVIGNYDLIIDLHVSNPLEIQTLISKLRERFPDIIKTFETLLVFKEYKINYLPNLD